jgi:hypothetical protein
MSVAALENIILFLRAAILKLLLRRDAAPQCNIMYFRYGGAVS